MSKLHEDRASEVGALRSDIYVLRMTTEVRVKNCLEHMPRADFQLLCSAIEEAG